MGQIQLCDSTHPCPSGNVCTVSPLGYGACTPPLPEGGMPADAGGPPDASAPADAGTIGDAGTLD
jgi:hypothetical protein